MGVEWISDSYLQTVDLERQLANTPEKRSAWVEKYGEELLRSFEGMHDKIDQLEDEAADADDEEEVDLSLLMSKLKDLNAKIGWGDIDGPETHKQLQEIIDDLEDSV